MRSGGWVARTGIMIVAVMLGACKQAPAPGTADNVDNAAAAQFADRMSGTPPPTPPAKPISVAEKSDMLEFSYSYPAQAAAIPFLVDRFGKELASSKADALAMAKDDKAAAVQSDFPFHAHSLETKWAVSADTPRFLALRSETYTYTGGAHGMTGYETLLWDKARKRETSVRAVMTSPAAFAAAIHDRFCKELDRQRAEKRGAPVVRGDDDFTKCIDPMDQVLAYTSKDGKLIDGVTVIVGPYNAGPYAEGSYDVGLPVDAALRKAIKTEYQDGFVKP
jgi:hypothetical protein